MMKNMLRNIASNVIALTSNGPEKYHVKATRLQEEIYADVAATEKKLEKKRWSQERAEQKLVTNQKTQKKVNKVMGAFDDDEEEDEYDRELVTAIGEIARKKLGALQDDETRLSEKNNALKYDVERTTQNRDHKSKILLIVNDLSNLTSPASSNASSRFGSSRVSYGGSLGSRGSPTGSRGSRGSRGSPTGSPTGSPPAVSDPARRTNSPVKRDNSTSTFHSALSRSDSVDTFSQPEPSPEVRVSPRHGNRQRMGNTRSLGDIVPLEIPPRRRPQEVVDSISGWIRHQ
jgi:hypothetical protein